MKKLLSVLLILSMLLSACSAFAENTGSTPPGEPPEGFSGGNPPGEPPEGFDGSMPPGEPPEGFGEGGRPGNPPDGFGGGTPPGGSSFNFEYTAAAEISSAAETTGESYVSNASDENALLIRTGDTVSVIDASVTKSGDSDGGDSCSFYGLNAAVLVMGGTEALISGGTVETSASGANGVFCYGGNGGRNGADGDGTTLYISGTTITTTGDGSGGIMTTGGGVTYAEDLTVTTSGRSSAAIRTDRGGGTVTANGGTYTTSGLGSPAIYSTADVTVRNAVLTSNLSEGVCIEGKNSITLENCSLTADNTQCNGNATFLDTIMIYQSMSGDADSGTSAFTMTGGSLTGLSGHLFHVTNTHAVITLDQVELTNEGSDILLSVCDDGWNGDDNIAEVYASRQALSGTLLVGDNSTLNLSLSDDSVFEGSVSGEITNAKGEQVSSSVGTVSVTLDETSTWALTADTWISSFSGNAENVISNGHTLYVNGIALEGTAGAA